jgi:hypothetical protein
MQAVGDIRDGRLQDKDKAPEDEDIGDGLQDNGKAPEDDTPPEICADTTPPFPNDKDTTPPLVNDKSITFGDIMAISKDIASCILKRNDIPTQVGMLLQLRENLVAAPHGTAFHDDSVSFEDIFHVHLSAFTRHNTNRAFTASENEEGKLQEAPLRRQGPPRQQGGRLPVKRLKSNQEKAVQGLPIQGDRPLTQSKPRLAVCSFCCMTGHKRGSTACTAYAKLRTTFLSYDNDFQRWSTRLGDPTLHLVEIPSQALVRSFANNVDFTAVIPQEVHHIVLVRCYYSRAHVDYMSTRVSQYKETRQKDLLTPPSMEFNVVEVILLLEGALRHPDLGDPCFMLVKTVRQWIFKNYKKTGSKYLLNSLPKAALINISNTY